MSFVGSRSSYLLSFEDLATRVTERRSAVGLLMEKETPVCGGSEAILNLQPNSSISVNYHSDFGPHDEIFLLEVDEKLLTVVMAERVTVRGLPDEDAVLCTDSKTYSIKFVGTSNSVFLVPPSTQSALGENSQSHNATTNGGSNSVASVIKVVPGSMELAEVAPRLDKLRSLLSINPLGFNELSEMDESEDGSGRPGLYGWDDLVELTQASDQELRSGLDALAAVEFDRHWRIVDEKYMDSILSMLLNNAVLNDWSLDSLPETEVIQMLECDGFPRKIALHCLRTFGNLVDECQGNGSVWKLDERQVCVHFARGILSGGKIKMDRFLEEWKLRIPSGMQASLDMLEGEVLVERIGIETLIRAFSASSLPQAPAERFSMLFRERAKWEWKDLEPYIRDMKVPGMSSDGLLLKYTRRTQPTASAEPIFSAR